MIDKFKEKFKDKFIEEATDNIKDLEQALLLLENNSEDNDLIERVFRAMHSLKGGGAMFGFEKLSEFTHHLENIYDRVREHEIKINKELLDLTFESVDLLKDLLDDNKIDTKELDESYKDIINRVNQIAENPDNENDLNNSFIEPESNVDKKKIKSYYLYFEPNIDIFKDGTNPLFLLDELQSIGKYKIYAHLNRIPKIDSIEVENCYTYWEAIITTDEDENAITDIFIFVEDQCKLEVNKVGEFNIFSYPDIIFKIDKLAEDRGDIGFDEIKKIANNIVSKKEEILDKKPSINKNVEKKKNHFSSIRVASNKLDQLMNLVSELVTTQARLGLYAENSNDAELNTIVENVQKLTRQLRDNAFDIVLVPIETMLTRFQRLIRDLSNDLGKKINFSAEGTDTELDKTIIESLSDPLLHIFRNCIDHGIESAEQRIKLNKPEEGEIILKAYYSGSDVHIQIHDDGAGIDAEKIRQKAISKNFISSDLILSKKEIFDLLFIPGFSTAKNVTDVSGRGVGMDVVKRKIADLRGDIEIDSEVNVGTTITLKLPLTLSIIDGLLITINNNFYIIPLSIVNKIYFVEHKKIANVFNNLIILDGERIPFYYLRQEFGLNTEINDEQIIVVKYRDKKIGFVVDTVVGEYQAVLKPLGKLYKKQEIISGATILGDGTVALVMDTNKMIQQFSKAKEDAHINN
ncbi:MAG: chemotaxis protein CheA [Bacteroidales bacterium]|jgi:two-component system chemotaxis sensor kinase CheA|nr:chemotaxis protein CheA [Bacteroidales bacterium]